MNKFKVTVIILVKDVKNLKKCLENIINQTLYGVEIVCLTNNSTTDSQIEIIKKLSDNNRIVLENNIFNIIQKAKGDYIFFIEKYHLLKEFTLELLYHEAITKKLDVVYFCNKDNLININKTIKGIDLFKDIVKNQFFPYQFIKKDLIIKSGVSIESFNSSLCNYQLMIKSQKVLCLNDILILDVLNDNKSNIDKSFHNNFKLYITLFNLASSIDLDNETYCIVNDILNENQKLVYSSYIKESPNISEFNLVEKYFLDLIIKPILLEETLSKNTKLSNKYKGQLNYYKNKCKIIKREVFKYKGQVKFHKSEKESLKKSLSFKIGRIITYIPRKIRNLLKK